MTEIDDQLLEKFFQPAKNVELDDNGFTEKMMRQLPDRAVRLSNWWTACCVIIGLAGFVVLKGWEPIVLGIVTVLKTNVGELHPVPFFMTLGVLSCLAILELAHKMERGQI